MKKIICVVLAVMLIASLAIAEGLMVGGWTHSQSPEITEENKALFDKGMEKLLGVDYEPVAYLGSQIVAGTNHCFLAQATVVAPDAQPAYKLVYLYENLEGEVEVLSIVDFDFGALCEY
ncbi:MAG: hypothetical protein IKI24_01730 [Clostridia bacterium]|nr:hypothetical protein [Clostridia bacterium]